MLAVSDRKAFVPGNGGALIPVEEHPQEDAPRAPSIGDSDSATRSTSSTSGGDDGNNNSTPDRRFAPINFLGWEEEEVSSRLQRVGGTGATRRPLTVNAMIERFRKQETKQDRDGEAVGTNAQSCDGYDSFVTQRCMTGPQFLDLANDCTLLKGCFGWEAAARVVHRVCRVGRDAKASWSKEIVGDLDVDAEDKRLSPPWRGSPGECEGRRENTCSSGNTSTSVSASSTSISTCSNSDDAAGSAVLTVGPTPRAKSRHGHDDKAIDVGEAGDGVSPGVGNYDGGSARQSSTTTSWPRTATPLSKEAAFLLATEDTEGGQGPMIFPEFVEALARLCLERYAPLSPWTPTPTRPPPAAKGHGKRPVDSRGMLPDCKGRSLARGQNTNLTTPSKSLGPALAPHRLRFAFERHLLYEVVNISQAPTKRTNREIDDMMERYAPRLKKIFVFFAVDGPSIVPAPSSGPTVSVASLETASAAATESSERKDRASAETFKAKRRRMTHHLGRNMKDIRLSVREFLGMLRSLEILDSRLTARDACRICATVMSLVIVANGQERGAGMGAVSQLSQKNRPRSSIDGDVLLSVGEDSMALEDFTRMVFHCGNLKTWDGVCSISQRMDAFVLNDLFERFLDRTGEASLWWNRGTN